EPFRVERSRHEWVQVSQVRWASSGQGGEQLGVEIAPSQCLLPNLESGEFLFELCDRRVLNDLDRLGLDFRMPDIELAGLLTDGGGRAREECSAGDTGREEPTAG